MKKLRASAILMVIAILGITGFQLYWLKNNYDREKESLQITTNAAFRQTILRLQSFKLKLDAINLRVDSAIGPRNISVTGFGKRPRTIFRRTTDDPQNDPPITIMNLIQEKMKDSVFLDSGSKRPMLLSFKRNGNGQISIDSQDKFEGQVGSMMITRHVDTMLPNPGDIRRVVVRNGSGIAIEMNTPEKQRELIDTLISRRVTRAEGMFEEGATGTSIAEDVMRIRPGSPRGNAVYRFLYDVDSLSRADSITVKEIDSAYTRRLKDEAINIDFTVRKLDSTQAAPPNAVTLGFAKPSTYTLSIDNSMSYMFGKLKLPILFSLLLVGITITSFVLLYRNMIRQRRLADLKNEFISNITHELKTPIATVGVAIEALKSFNAIHDPKRTAEYLDISQNELQRLNLLVDKVLKLSMFEKKEIELKYEIVNLKEIVEEVVASMRLQSAKHGATVSINSQGETMLNADRLHLLSVVFNLLDNALKYGGERPLITIALEEIENAIVLKVSDSGIGIPSEYKDRIFEKFFRVPHGDTHNAKGYGLGLSYVAHVVKKHKGTITLDSQTGNGTTFIITLPKNSNERN